MIYLCGMNTLIDNNKKYSDTRVRDPNKSSMASNHLSKYGRFGDNMMYRTSEGELWHVNKEEKEQMDSLGKAGEHLVAVRGAGTINPDTGLKEQFIDPLTAATFGIGLLGAYQSYQSSLGSSRAQAELARESLVELEKAEKLLPKIKSAREDLLDLDLDLTSKKISDDSSRVIKKTMSDLDRSISKTGLVNVGQISEVKSNTLKDVLDKANKARESASSKFKIGLGELEGWFTSQQSKLDMEKRKTQSMLDLYESQSNQKFLGLF